VGVAVERAADVLVDGDQQARAGAGHLLDRLARAGGEDQRGVGGGGVALERGEVEADQRALREGAALVRERSSSVKTSWAVDKGLERALGRTGRRTGPRGPSRYCSDS
jgi:hypothetical protein